MNLDFTISAAQHVVVVTAHEPLKLPETLAQCARLATEPDFTPGFSLLLDARGLRKFAGPNQRRVLSEAARSLRGAGMRRVAIVVGSERTFNLAKISADLAHDVGLELGVFRSMLAALYWVDFPRAHKLLGTVDDVPGAVLADIGGAKDELEELGRLRRAS